MPTDDQNLARVCKALLAAGAVVCDDIDVVTPDGSITQKGWRLSVRSSIVIDDQHARSVLQCNLGGLDNHHI